MMVCYINLRLSLHFRKKDGKGGTLSGRRPGCNVSMMIFSYFLTNRQPYPGTRIFSAGMQPLENLEDLMGMGFVKTDTVILKVYSPGGFV